MSTTVTYKGNTLVTVSNNTKTLKTAGKYMEGDVVLTDVSGSSSASKKQINFIDYDGTIVESYTKTEWQSVTALPSNPSHTGLTAQGWNWTKAQIDAQITSVPSSDIWVGQMYITDNGKTRIYIHLEEGRLHPYLGICPNGTVVVDWGRRLCYVYADGNIADNGTARRPRICEWRRLCDYAYCIEW